MRIEDLQGKRQAELKEIARSMGLTGFSTLRKQDLIYLIMEAQAEAVADTGGEEQGDLAIFISHSSKDKDIAELFIQLLKDALSLGVEDIRCSSVPGYTFPAGASIEESVKREAFGAQALIGLLTPNSLRSTWVLFELGARWGAGKRIIPVLAKGASIRDLGGPLPNSVLLNSSNEDDLYQLVGDLAQELRRDFRSADSYRTWVQKILDFNQQVQPDDTQSSVRPSDIEASIKVLQTERLVKEFMDFVEEFHGGDFIQEPSGEITRFGVLRLVEIKWTEQWGRQFVLTELGQVVARELLIRGINA